MAWIRWLGGIPRKRKVKRFYAIAKGKVPSNYNLYTTICKD